MNIADIERMGLNVDLELFSAFAFYAAIVLVKMLFMSFLTARWPFLKFLSILFEVATLTDL